MVDLRNSAWRLAINRLQHHLLGAIGFHPDDEDQIAYAVKPIVKTIQSARTASRHNHIDRHF